LQSWQEVVPLWFGGEWVLRGVLPVAVIVGEILAVMMAMVMMMIAHRRMNSLLCLYL